MSQEALAAVMAAHGVPWTRESVAALEAGRRRLLFREFVWLEETLGAGSRDLWPEADRIADMEKAPPGAQRRPGPFERRLMNRFGLSYTELLKAGRHLKWRDHSPAAERDRRAENRPGAKQWISRELGDELARFLARRTG